MNASSDDYAVIHEIPLVETYRTLRARTGLSAKSEAAATRGLPGSLFAVQILCDGEPIGMGRLVGDGGCHYLVVDIAVLPEHQGQGLGKRIMREIMDFVEVHVPETAYVSLIADGPAKDLYAQFGFVPVGPASIGMAMRRGG
ncbi:MAG TPA: GNAT family N-acetyltransferase [Caulobacteraceae bacterium]